MEMCDFFYPPLTVSLGYYWKPLSLKIVPKTELSIVQCDK